MVRSSSSEATGRGLPAPPLEAARLEAARRRHVSMRYVTFGRFFKGKSIALLARNFDFRKGGHLKTTKGNSMTVFPDSSQFFSRKQALSTIVPALPQNRQKTVRKRTVKQRLMCGFRLHVAPHVRHQRKRTQALEFTAARRAQLFSVSIHVQIQPPETSHFLWQGYGTVPHPRDL